MRPRSRVSRSSVASSGLSRLPAASPSTTVQVRALATAFRIVGPPHAHQVDQPSLAVAFAQVADFFERSWPDLLTTSGCTFPLPPLALPSGALGYVYLAAWPALQVELERQGVEATGPILDAGKVLATPRSRRGGAPALCFRLVFDPARVGPTSGYAWIERPGPGALALGDRASTGVSMRRHRLSRLRGLDRRRLVCQPGGSRGGAERGRAATDLGGPPRWPAVASSLRGDRRHRAGLSSPGLTPTGCRGSTRGLTAHNVSDGSSRSARPRGERDSP